MVCPLLGGWRNSAISSDPTAAKRPEGSRCRRRWLAAALPANSGTRRQKRAVSRGAPSTSRCSRSKECPQLINTPRSVSSGSPMGQLHGRQADGECI